MTTSTQRTDPSPETATGKSQGKVLRWYQKALVVPILAIAIFGASLTAPGQALADHLNYWGQCFTSYGMTWYGQCLIGVDHTTGRHYEIGWGYWEVFDQKFVYFPHNNQCQYWEWYSGYGWYGPLRADYCSW